jgi:hypothetical protein
LKTKYPPPKATRSSNLRIKDRKEKLEIDQLFESTIQEEKKLAENRKAVLYIII